MENKERNRPTVKECFDLVHFELVDNQWMVAEVKTDVTGDVKGTIWGNVEGNVEGTIQGYKWSPGERSDTRLRRLIKQGADKQTLLSALEDLLGDEILRRF